MTSSKKKRVSKKTKQSWRKHVDIKDVEQFLEDGRSDERLGSFDKIADNDLFKIDTKPQKISELTKKQKRELISKTLPRCFSVLQSHSKVPDPITKRNRVRTKEERRDRIAKSIEESRRLQGIVKAKDRIAQQTRQSNQAKKEAKKYKLGDFNQNLWEVEDFHSEGVEPIKKDEWLNNDTVRHTLHGLGRLRKSIPKSLNTKNTLLPTIEAPHPGMSYNPSLEDHLKLLNEVAEKEMKIIKEEKHIERVTSRMFKKVSPETKENNWLVEMSEGLPNQNPEDNEDAGNEDEYKALNPAVKNNKKDRKQKRKQKEQRELERVRNIAKMEKKKIADIYKLKKISQDIEKRNEKITKLQEKRVKREKLKQLEPKTLSKVKFEDPDLEFNMGQDITGNLRNVKTEGNILKDRFKSLQKRNILEPTVMQPPRKRPKVKKFEKATHKMGWEPKGY